MVCGSCGTENKPGRRFCAECGAALAATCPSCGTPFEAGEKFCGSCGARLAGAPTASADLLASAVPAVVEPVAERRLVSVLFADLERMRATLLLERSRVGRVLVRRGGASVRQP